jgi:hypothetical protein
LAITKIKPQVADWLEFIAMEPAVLRRRSERLSDRSGQDSDMRNQFMGQLRFFRSHLESLQPRLHVVEAGMDDARSSHIATDPVAIRQ